MKAKDYAFKVFADETAKLEKFLDISMLAAKSLGDIEIDEEKISFYYGAISCEDLGYFETIKKAFESHGYKIKINPRLIYATPDTGAHIGFDILGTPFVLWFAGKPEDISGMFGVWFVNNGEKWKWHFNEEATE